MSRFNTRTARPAGTSPVKSTTGATTHEGGQGWLRDTRSELFLLAVTNMVGASTFYESGGERDDRFTQLVRQLAVEDPEWTAGLLGWLRSDGNMRTAAVVGAAEFTRGRLDAGAHGHSRQVVASVLQRADEPGELLAYWTARYGRSLPKPIKRGIADAIGRLYTERALLKYDTDSRGFRFADVIELVHPAPATGRPWQGDLFAHAINRRHGRGEATPDTLPTLQAAQTLAAIPVEQRRAYVLDPSLVTPPGGLAGAGFTWERLAGWLQGPMDAAAWEAIIPSMGYMALLRNLRNFDEAGVSDEVAERIAKRLADPEEVGRSRQFPFRYLAAYRNTRSLRWAHALERALGASLKNVPSLPGRTLVLVDRSPSMFPGCIFSTPNSSDITLADQAAIFGTAVALRAQSADLVEFGQTSRVLNVPPGGAALRIVEQFGQIDGTDIPSAVKQHLAGHDRVVIVTDEQTRPGWLPSNCGGYGGMRETHIDDLVPHQVPVYMWNMAGYKVGATPAGAGNRHTFGGLTDAAFRMVPLIEQGRSAHWPWSN